MDNYISPIRDITRKSEGINLESVLPVKKGLNVDNTTWLTTDDDTRIKNYENNRKLYKGKHYIGDDGVFPHPYRTKGVRENIPYQQENILQIAVDFFADMIIGDGIEFFCDDEKTCEYIENIELLQKSRKFLVDSAIYGFCGAQPIETSENCWNFSFIHPRFLFLEKDYTQNSIVTIRKLIPYMNVNVGKDKTISVLYEECHAKGYVETFLYEISGRKIIKQLPLDFFTKYIDKNVQLLDAYDTGLDDFLITLFFNKDLENCEFFENENESDLSDFTVSAKRLQESLNDTKTQIFRILKRNSDPKLIAPFENAQKNSVNGEVTWFNANSEVLFVKPNEKAYEYLTWNGNVDQLFSQENRLITGLCAELKIPVFATEKSELFSQTSADTSSKIKRMMSRTLKEADRKWYSFDKSLRTLINNLIKLCNLNPDYSLKYAEFVTQDIEEKLDYIVTRKNNNLISAQESLQILDDLTEEQALEKLTKINNELNNNLSNDVNFSKIEQIQTNEPEQITNEFANTDEPIENLH